MASSHERARRIPAHCKLRGSFRTTRQNCSEQECAWRAFLLTANYEDRFGPLGKIAVVVGRCLRNKLYVDIWVMSCRAFLRHIEYHVLARLFENFGVDCIEFAFRPTERNGPLQEFFTRFFPHGLTAERFELSANVFMA